MCENNIWSMTDVLYYYYLFNFIRPTGVLFKLK